MNADQLSRIADLEATVADQKEEIEEYVRVLRHYTGIVFSQKEQLKEKDEEIEPYGFVVVLHR